jgi:AcrR family transcriptional regulator
MSILQPMNPRINDTKSAILITAAALFSNKGYAGTSMADLAEELGLSKAAIYHHFESKEALLRELMESTFKELETLIIRYEATPANRIDLHDLLSNFALITFSHRDVIRLVLSELPAEMKGKERKGHQYAGRLQKLLAGPKSTVESAMRAKAAVVIIATGILPPRLQKNAKSEDPDLNLLIAIASDALGLKKTKRR